MKMKDKIKKTKVSIKDITQCNQCVYFDRKNKQCVLGQNCLYTKK